jgi:hypothetical protein
MALRKILKMEDPISLNEGMKPLHSKATGASKLVWEQHRRCLNRASDARSFEEEPSHKDSPFGAANSK